MSSPQIPGNSTNPSTTSGNMSSSTIKVTKRKLEDAFQILDDAVGSSDSAERPPPPKRTHTARSLYSTLAKYGIKSSSKLNASESNLGTLSKSTPHLTAILSRAATRTRKTFPFRFSNTTPSTATPLPSTAEYRPSSISSFLARLSTFKLATYANKPPIVDAVAAAKCGWINDGKDRLVCGLCNSSWVVAGREGMSRDAANALIEKQRISLVEAHKNGCPWKTRQCDATIYRIPLRSPVVMVRDIKANAMTLNSILQGVEIKHPLTSTQLNSLRSTISAFAFPVPTISEDATEVEKPHTPPSSPPPALTGLSDTAVLTTLFGWTLVPPTTAESPRRVGSGSRAASLAPSLTPSISRASSVVHSRAPTPAPGQSLSRPFTFRVPSSRASIRDTSLLHCALCQRRLGLWAFVPQPSVDTIPSASPNGEHESSVPSDAPNAPLAKRAQRSQRQFDLLREHRSYCPYVVRSTIVPSLPAPPTSATSSTSHTPTGPLNSHARSNSSLSHLTSSLSQLGGPPGAGGALEGWRAVLTVVLRYGMGQRQKNTLNVFRTEGGNPEEDTSEPMEVDGVKAMVAGVKSRGGKDLLKYVKGLLG